jgi:Lar family restriction alleviation protein
MKIKSCPFCGSDDVCLYELDMCRDAQYSVFCNGCEANGPCTENEKDKAIELWNTPRRNDA